MDYELTLINLEYGENGMGDALEIETEEVVLCDVLSVTRSEHYQAQAHGLKPEIVFRLNQYEYNNQKKVKFEGTYYKIDRTFIPKKSKKIEDFEKIELICSGVVHNVIT